jgi:integrase/recombinase XerD
MNESLFPQVNAFRDFLQCQHYGSKTSNDYEKHVLNFLQWCKQSSIQGSESLEKYLRDYLRIHRPRKGSQAKFNMMRAAIHNYFFYCTGKKLPLYPKVFVHDWIANEIDGFCIYLNDVAALREESIVSHRHYIARFLNYASDNGLYEVSQLTARIVRDFLAAELVHYKSSSKKTIITRIRNYFRFLEFRGMSNSEEVLKLPMSAPVWSMSSIPKTLTDAEIEDLLSCFDRSKAEDARDYAIAICMVELGACRINP